MRQTLFIAVFLVIMPMAYCQESHPSFLQARALILNKQYSEAIPLLDAALKSNHRDPNILFERGICYFNKKQYDLAREDFIQVNALEKAKASYMLARIEAKLGHPGIAVKFLRENLNSQYKVSEKELMLQDDFTKISESNEWKNLLKEAWYTEDDQDLLHAEFLVENEDFPEAINLLNTLEKKRTNPTKVNYLLAKTFFESGNLRDAQSAVDKSLSTDSQNKYALKLRIKIYEKKQDYLKAMTDCDRLLRMAPDDFDYYLVSADVSSKAGQYSKALKRIEGYIEIFPDSANAYNLLGEIHYREGKYLTAIPAFNKSLQLDDSRATTYRNRGRTYYYTRTYKYAFNDLSMSLDLDPYDAETWYYKGKVEEALSNPEAACSAFKKALQYGKNEAHNEVIKLCGY